MTTVVVLAVACGVLMIGIVIAVLWVLDANRDARHAEADAAELRASLAARAAELLSLRADLVAQARRHATEMARMDDVARLKDAAVAELQAFVDGLKGDPDFPAILRARLNRLGRN